MRVIIHGVFEWSVGIPNDGNPGTIHGIYRSSPTEHGSHGRLNCPYLLVKFVGCLLLGYELMNSHWILWIRLGPCLRYIQTSSHTAEWDIIGIHTHALITGPGFHNSQLWPQLTKCCEGSSHLYILYVIRIAVLKKIEGKRANIWRLSCPIEFMLLGEVVSPIFSHIIICDINMYIYIMYIYNIWSLQE